VSINNSIAYKHIATVTLKNGQTIEQDIMATTRSKARSQLKRDANISKIINIRKPKL
jgi:hypothetical protein